ncbi:TIGR00366 family protein [Bacillus sp. PK3_68]|uniref:YfcC family protein n=1 Tax=Bacillus sp. PK3_68 TaxID=2027408 RepID=UPI000E72FAEA|nr:TIGR00366 family protein [Bacillus sp. PK3_68]RJS61493.1 C4-dicarboxylate ABC transporter permease [Bacillus sp. PK3_68]
MNNLTKQNISSEPLNQPTNSTTQLNELPEKGINPFVLMFVVIAIVTALTYILPAGQYARIEKEGRSVVDPSSFQFVDSTPVGLLEMFSSVHAGMIEGASIILFVFLFGGALGIMQATGAIDSFIKFVAVRFGSKEKLLIPLMVLVFASLGTLIGSAEDALVYIAIVVPMTVALGFDALTGFAIVMLGTLATGFISGLTNPFNVGVAQSIAELPMYSGMGLRIAILAAFYVLTVVYIYRHAMKVKRNPELGEYGKFSREEQTQLDKSFKMGKRHFFALMVLLLNFIFLVYGVIKLGWYISEIGGLFLLSAIIMGFIGGLSPSRMANGFISGASDMVSGALIIGIAQTILVIITNGGLLDTILYYAAGLVEHLPPAINAVGMFIVQMFLNFIVPSGSGQAALTMPIMAPLADLMGVTRQTAVLAFQLGDGISNMIFPTSGLLLAGLAVAGISFTKWVKWVLPYLAIQVVIAVIFLVIAQVIHYGPF